MTACGEKFDGVVMAPLAYPSVGWEPIRETDECVLDQGHEGKHRGRLLEWNAEHSQDKKPES